jgi:multiple sugar transport system permease protein
MVNMSTTKTRSSESTPDRKKRSWWQRPRDAGQDQNALIGHSKIVPYALSTPAIVVVGFLLAFPVLYAAFGSLYRAEFMGGETEYVGLQNYIDLLSDADFLWALNRTAVFVGGCLVFGLSLSLVFAFALNKAGRRLRFLRGLTIVPYLVSGVAAAVMFRLLFNDQFGAVNRIIGWFGVDPPAWFAETGWVMLAAIATQVWTDLPLAVLLILGGLQTIDPSLLDAAEVDGATGWKRTTRVSLPLIVPQLAIATIWFSYATLTSLGVVLALTGGGPLKATRTLPIHLYETAFVELRRNEALAIVIFVLLLNGLLTLVYATFSRRFDLGN